MSSLVTVYSSAPETTQLAVAFQGLRRQGLSVQVRPLSALPPSPSPGVPARSALYAQWEAVTVELATLGERLSAHETGRVRLGAGEEQGLRALRDSLQARQRGLSGSLKAIRGG